MYPANRVVFQIDGNLVAIMHLVWDPQKCFDCNGYHFELLKGRGTIDHKSWCYKILPLNFGDT